MQLKWGICSAAKVANDFCVALKTLPGEEHKIQAIAARELASAQKFADVFEIESVYEGYDALAADADVNVVYIASINSAHFDLCKKFIAAGKNVVCEKTLCLNTAQTEEVYALAKSAKVFIMEALWSRFMPVYKKLKELVDTKAIGTVRFAQATFGYPIMVHERIKQPQMGGGALLDLGCYAVQAVLAAFGDQEPERVEASGTLATSGVDETSFVQLFYPNGATATAQCSALCQLQNEAFVCGDLGTIKISCPFWCPEEIEVQRYEETGHNEKRRLPLETYKFPHPHSDRRMNFVNSTGFAYEASAVRAALMEGKLEADDWTHQQSIRLARILTKARLQIGYILPCDK